MTRQQCSTEVLKMSSHVCILFKHSEILMFGREFIHSPLSILQTKMPKKPKQVAKWPLCSAVFSGEIECGRVYFIFSLLPLWCEELTHLKRPWCWERLQAGREGDNREWDGWMASLTQRTWVWVSSGSWWWTGKPGVLQSIGSQGVGHDWVTELNSLYFGHISHVCRIFVPPAKGSSDPQQGKH